MKRTKFRILLYYIATSLFWFSLYAYVPTLSTYAKSQGASFKMVGLIIGSYGFTQMLLRIPLGIVSDRLQRRKPFILLGFICALIGALGMAFLPGEGFLLVFRSLTGVAAASWVPFTVLFSSYFDLKDTSKAIGYLTASCILGQVMAMFLGGIVTERAGQQWTFLLAAAGGAIGVAIGTGIIEKRDIKKEPIKIQGLISVTKESDLLLFSVLAIFVNFMAFATIYGFTPIAAKQIGASNFDVGLLTTLSTLPGIFASALSGSFFAKRIGEKSIILLGFTTMSVFCIIIPYIRNMSLLFIIQILYGFALGMLFSLLMGLAIRNVKNEKRATAMGFYQAVYGLGMFAGPLVTGVLIDTIGLKPGFWFVGIIGFCGILLATGYKDKIVNSLPINQI